MNAGAEEEWFQNIKESRQGASEHNKTPGGYSTAWLNADRGRILGASRTQEVQKGDSVELGVFGTPIAIGVRSSENPAECSLRLIF